jgi:hypothetical protein
MDIRMLRYCATAIALVLLGTFCLSLLLLVVRWTTDCCQGVRKKYKGGARGAGRTEEARSAGGVEEQQERSWAGSTIGIPLHTMKPQKVNKLSAELTGHETGHRMQEGSGGGLGGEEGSRGSPWQFGEDGGAERTTLNTEGSGSGGGVVGIADGRAGLDTLDVLLHRHDQERGVLQRRQAAELRSFLGPPSLPGTSATRVGGHGSIPSSTTILDNDE